MWPDYEIKSSPSFPKVAPKGTTVVFTEVLCFPTVAQKVIINVGYFLKKICHPDFPKIAQSGHTVRYWCTLEMAERMNETKGSKFFWQMCQKVWVEPLAHSRTLQILRQERLFSFKTFLSLSLLRFDNLEDYYLLSFFYLKNWKIETVEIFNYENELNITGDVRTSSKGFDQL